MNKSIYEKALMISIQPQHAVNILIGKKTLELRTWIPKGYVGWVYVYVTKNEPYLIWNNGNYILYTPKINLAPYSLNGKVAFRFWFDDYETYIHGNHGVGLYNDDAEYSVMYDDLDKLCLDYREIENYGKGKDLYAWHIKKLEVFDEPKQLSEFYKKVEFSWADTGYMNTGGEPIEYHPIEKAPQRSVWVYII